MFITSSHFHLNRIWLGHVYFTWNTPKSNAFDLGYLFSSHNTLPSRTRSTRDTFSFTQYPPTSNAFDLGYLFIFTISSNVERIQLGIPFYFHNILQRRTHSTWDTFLFSQYPPTSNVFDLGYPFIFTISSCAEHIRLGIPFHFTNHTPKSNKFKIYHLDAIFNSNVTKYIPKSNTKDLFDLGGIWKFILTLAVPKP